ncbi:MAG TPA: pyridoxamine 5'-phosphate oxidase family protein [Solirubrobacteraceae bacterium]|nr:pyridoxamine 5'-phosphate oxidase family protein [Solirubrobacteraceae bacterium]
MTASLPDDVQSVFQRFVTTELTTVDGRGQPITWPVTPYYSPGAPCIDVTTGLGYPKKANDARANPMVALLFSDPTGSGLSDPPMVLVQGTADVDDRDLEANRRRYARESLEKLPGIRPLTPPQPVQRLLGWYYSRIYIHIRPERVYVWPLGAVDAEPELYGSHMEEVRSGHSEEPERFHADPSGGTTAWHPRLGELGVSFPTAVLSFVSPDGFPFAVRVGVRSEETARRINVQSDPCGVPLQPGLACLTAHRHAETFSWQENFQVRGDLVRAEDRWVLVPRKLVGGFEVPPSRAKALRVNATKALRFHRTAKREMVRRG